MNKPSAKSLSALLLIFIVLASVLISRLFYLQVIQHHRFKTKSQFQVKKTLKISSFRGKILDANGQALALSEPTYSLYIAPPLFKDKPENLEKLKKIATFLQIPFEKLLKKSQAKHSFVWVKRKLSYDQHLSLKSFLCQGLYFIEEEKRYYPENHLASDLIGFVGLDGGLGGIEYSQDKILKGSEGHLQIEGDTQGRPFLSAKAAVVGTPKSFWITRNKNPDYSFDGESIYLTLDKSLQYKTEYYLNKMIQEQEAKQGQAIIMSVKTGHVLALADIPSFNPNSFYNYPQETLKNSTIVDVFEPGSILKPFVYAIGLDKKVFEESTHWDLPESIIIDKRLIREAHKRPEDESSIYTSQAIIQKSLNVGTTQMAFKIGAESLYQGLRSFGFGKRSQAVLPGESPGILSHYSRWADANLATISFGQGVSVNLLQMAAAYTALAYEGQYRSPQIIQKITNENGSILNQQNNNQQAKQIISKESAQKTLAALEATVEEGSGIRAKIPGFRIGGKTGTAQIPDLEKGGYKKGAYLSSFVMVFPIDDPQFVIAVSIQEAQKEYYGSRVALPVAKSLAYELINHFNLQPQKGTATLNRKWDPLL